MSMLTKRKAPPAKLAAPFVKTNTKKPTKTTIDETRTSVSGTEALQTTRMETIEISSDADSDEDLSDDNEEENEVAAQQEEQQQQQQQEAQVNGEHPPSTLAENTQLDEEEPTSPSFGELLRGNTEAIDLTVMLRQHTSAATATVAVGGAARAAAAANDAAIRSERTAIVPPTHQSLATVLSQALSTDDTDLLETCLSTTDLPTIRNTIERIDSSLAGILLHKLAARLHRRPGRAGTLMTWVQWTLVAHGGALASQTKVVHSLSSLQKVLSDRAKGLTSLLALKGKLDVLEGQMELRRKMQQQSVDKAGGAANRMHEEEAEQNYGDDDDEDEEDALYVEGEEHDAALANGRRNPIEDTDDAVLVNGFTNDSDDEEEQDSDAAGGEESDDADDDDAEDLDEEEVNYDDVDDSMGEDEESDVETAPPAKLQKVTKSFNKKK